MLQPVDRDILARVHQNTPQLIKVLKSLYQDELDILPSMSLDKVQLHQGRTLMLRELIAQIESAAGISANRTAKP